jgi:DNA-directed RNA polymerase specialized sigma24 family protein
LRRDYDDLLQDIICEIEHIRYDPHMDWSALFHTHFGTDAHDRVREQLMRAIERVLDRHRPSRQPLDVRNRSTCPQEPTDPVPMDNEWDLLLEPLTEPQKLIVREVVGLGKSVPRVAREMNVKPAVVRLAVETALNKIRRMLE